jgi:hypothetical protein
MIHLFLLNLTIVLVTVAVYVITFLLKARIADETKY